MFQTVTVDIMSEKALKLLTDLERLKLIRLHQYINTSYVADSAAGKYKGAMTKQPLHEIDQQLNELRGEWE